MRADRIAWVLGASIALAAPAVAGEEERPVERVWVELQSDNPLAVLEKRPASLRGRGDLAGIDGWQAVCLAPCRAEMSREDRLRVGGSGVDQLYFHLPEEPGPYTVYAETGSAGAEAAGLAMVLTGASLVMLGAITTVVLATGPLKNADAESAPTIAFHASITSMILGGVVLAIGAPLRFSAIGDLKIERRTPADAPAVAPSNPEPKVELTSGLYLTPRGLAF